MAERKKENSNKGKGEQAKRFKKNKNLETILTLVLVVVDGHTAIDGQRFRAQYQIVDLRLREEANAVHETVVEAFAVQYPDILVLQDLNAVHRHRFLRRCGIEHHDLIIGIPDNNFPVAAHIHNIDRIRFLTLKNRHVVRILCHQIASLAVRHHLSSSPQVIINKRSNLFLSLKTSHNSTLSNY